MDLLNNITRIIAGNHFVSQKKIRNCRIPINEIIDLMMEKVKTKDLIYDGEKNDGAHSFYTEHKGWRFVINYNTRQGKPGVAYLTTTHTV